MRDVVKAQSLIVDAAALYEEGKVNMQTGWRQLVECGRMLNEAKEECSHGEWEEFSGRLFPASASWRCFLMKVAAYRAELEASGFDWSNATKSRVAEALDRLGIAKNFLPDSMRREDDSKFAPMLNLPQVPVNTDPPQEVYPSSQAPEPQKTSLPQAVGSRKPAPPPPAPIPVVPDNSTIPADLSPKHREGHDLIEEARRLLWTARSKLLNADPSLFPAQAKEALDRIDSMLKYQSIANAMLCPTCRGDAFKTKIKCDTCRQRGWITLQTAKYLAETATPKTA